MRLKIPRIIRGWEHAGKIVPNFANMQPNTVSFGREFSRQVNAPYWDEAVAVFGLTPAVVEPMFLNMTARHYLDGASLQDHKDGAPDGFVHARCNVMLEKPEIGGNPVIDGEELCVNKGDIWLCLASLEWHSSTPIFNGNRVIFSFGDLVPIEQIMRIQGDHCAT